MQFSCLRFETLCPHEEVQKVQFFRIFWSFPGVKKVSSHNILQSCFVRCWIRSLFTKTVYNMSLNCQKDVSGFFLVFDIIPKLSKVTILEPVSPIMLKWCTALCFWIVVFGNTDPNNQNLDKNCIDVKLKTSRMAINFGFELTLIHENFLKLLRKMHEEVKIWASFQSPQQQSFFWRICENPLTKDFLNTNQTIQFDFFPG